MCTRFVRLFVIIWPHFFISFFFFNDTATTEIYTLSLHDALPILTRRNRRMSGACSRNIVPPIAVSKSAIAAKTRSEEHTSELQSPDHLVCRLLLEKKHKAKLQQQNGTLYTEQKH